MRPHTISLILVCVALCSAQGLPPGVLQEVDLDGVIGFPNEFEVTAMAVDPTGDVYLAGTLQSVPEETTAILTAGALAEDNILIVKMDAALERVLYKTVIGGSGQEILYAMTVDESGAVYLSGITRSEDFPETFGLAQPLSISGQQAFVVKLNAQGDAEVLEVGSAPHHILGITRVTVRIPEGANAGDFAVTLSLPDEPDAGYAANGRLWLPPGALSSP